MTATPFHKMLQHTFHTCDHDKKKPAKYRKKAGKVYLLRNQRAERVDYQRPQSTGVMLSQKLWEVDEGRFLRSRATTYSISPSSFYDFTNTETCYDCLFDEVNGREFCEIMGPRYCNLCIKTNKRKENDEEVISALGISENHGFASSLRETILHIRQSPTLAFSTDRKLFSRLHNFNSNSEYYINPTDGIGTESSRVMSSDGDREKPLSGQGTQNSLQVPESENCATSQGIQGILNKKRRKKGVSGKLKRKFVTFNGLPIEPPLITVDLSNQIMNHLVINDS